MSEHSDRITERNRRRATLRSLADDADRRGDRGKADRIRAHNLGTAKRERQARRWRAQVRTVTFTAVHAVVDKACVVVAENLTKTFTGRTRFGKNTNHRPAAWTKGVTADALSNVSERRGSALVLVNAAYTSHHQVRRILQARTDRHRTRLPVQDSSRVVDDGERTIRPCSTLSNE